MHVISESLTSPSLPTITFFPFQHILKKLKFPQILFHIFPQIPYLILTSPASNTAPPHQPIRSHHSHYPSAPKVPQPTQALSTVHLSLYQVI